MKNQLNKVKDFLKKNKGKIITVVTSTGVVVFSFVVGKKFTEFQFSAALNELTDSGIIKLMNPLTNEEITWDTALDVFKQVTNK